MTVGRTVTGAVLISGPTPSTAPTEMGAAPPLPSFGDLSPPVVGAPVVLDVVIGKVVSLSPRPSLAARRVLTTGD